jgi:putative oxidoreductase
MRGAALAAEVNAMPEMSRFGTLVGRILLALVFLVSGTAKILDPAGTSQHMAAQGMQHVSVFLVAAAALELAGALSLLLGWHARLGAGLLILFLVPTTLVFHDFWSFTGSERTQQMIQFLKNLSILGGLFYAATVGAPVLSLDARRARPRHPRAAAAAHA